MRNIGSRYRIDDEPLGRGASGTVYRGFDDQDQVVAVKILYPQLTHNPTVVTRFTQERRVLAGVRDPHVVSVLDLVAEGDTLAIVMEHVEGPNLHDWLAANRNVSAATVAELGGDIARGLAALHAADVVHCDLKPANVLVDTSNNHVQPKIVDFGISTLLTKSSDTTTAVTGTPRYMAPEVLQHQRATPATDVYALGMVLYELAAGVPAFSGSAQQVARAQLDLAPGRIDSVPRPLWDIIESALEKDPADRPSAGRIAAALERVRPTLDAETPLPRYSTPPVPQLATSPGTHSEETVAVPAQAVPSTSKRSRGPLIVVGAAILAILAGIGAFALRPDSGQEGATAAGPAGPTSEASSAAPSPTVSPATPEAPVALTSLITGVQKAIGTVGEAQIAGGNQTFPNSVIGGEIDLTVKTERKYSQFSTTIGLDKNSSPDSCEVRIVADGDEIINEVSTYETGQKPILNVPIEDVYELTLFALCDFEDTAFVFGNPTLTAKGTTTSPATPSA